MPKDPWRRPVEIPSLPPLPLPDRAQPVDRSPREGDSRPAPRIIAPDQRRVAGAA
jgi:hypothetical protein